MDKVNSETNTLFYNWQLPTHELETQVLQPEEHFNYKYYCDEILRQNFERNLLLSLILFTHIVYHIYFFIQNIL